MEIILSKSITEIPEQGIYLGGGEVDLKLWINIPEFMKVCAGVGIGSALYKPGKPLDAIAKDAAAMVAGVKI